MPNSVLAEVQMGFNSEPGAKCPYIPTSINGDAWAIGRWLGQTGHPEPREAFKSRGDTYRIGDMLIGVKWKFGEPLIKRLK